MPEEKVPDYIVSLCTGSKPCETEASKRLEELMDFIDAEILRRDTHQISSADVKIRGGDREMLIEEILDYRVPGDYYDPSKLLPPDCPDLEEEQSRLRALIKNLRDTIYKENHHA